MYLKDITDNDMYHFWPSCDVVPGLNVIHRLIRPTPEVVKVHLGKEYPVKSMTLCDDMRRGTGRRRVIDKYFMSYAHDYVHYSHSDDKIEFIADALEIDIQVLPNHPELVEGDYWSGSEKPFARFTVLGFISYLNKCYEEMLFIDPKDFVDPERYSDEPGEPCRAATRLTHQIFSPERDDIDKINAMSFILHQGFFGCKDTDKDKSDELGVPQLREMRNVVTDTAIV